MENKLPYYGLPNVKNAESRKRLHKVLEVDQDGHQVDKESR